MELPQNALHEEDPRNAHSVQADHSFASVSLAQRRRNALRRGLASSAERKWGVPFAGQQYARLGIQAPVKDWAARWEDLVQHGTVLRTPGISSVPLPIN